ncbi:hypothetical protein CsSME_00007441 [Camellia sinensis var. sinensis]
MAASSVRRHRAACDGGKRATAARHVSLQLSHLLNLLRPHAHRFTKQKAKTNSHRLCVRQSSDKNFDDVLVPEDHVSRSYNDTYYVDSQTVLRCHICAHQAELLRKGHTHFLVTGDVYRRDSIDSTHRPVFHQMEGFRVFTPDDWQPSGMDGTSYVAEDLKKCLEGLARHLFGSVEMH